MKNVLNKNLDLKGKKVLLRVDLNVPMENGAITETSRIEKIIPTIKLLLEKPLSTPTILMFSLERKEKIAKY